ncbi:MAG: hypothetical protein SGARI_004531 [Bacillariaceae sp.]
MQDLLGQQLIPLWGSSASPPFDPQDFLNEEGQPYYPPLTQVELEHRKAEMLLIAKLNQGDRPYIANLQNFWFSERGEDVKTLLRHADFGIGKGPEHWEETLLIFQDVIRQDPTFLEPQARYAKLLCLQGQFEEAALWAQKVLDSRPWHFVTIETMVAIHTAKGDSILAELWTERRLPNPSKPEARSQWVDRALADAEVILGRMQQQRAERGGG